MSSEASHDVAIGGLLGAEAGEAGDCVGFPVPHSQQHDPVQGVVPAPVPATGEAVKGALSVGIGATPASTKVASISSSRVSFRLFLAFPRCPLRVSDEVCVAEVREWADWLEDIRELIGPRFSRSEPRENAVASPRALLSSAER